MNRQLIIGLCAYVAVMFLLVAAGKCFAAEETPHCVTKKEWPLIITQCDDGTVTVANVNKRTASVCRKGETCQEVPL